MLTFLSSSGRISTTDGDGDGSKKQKTDIRESFASQNVPKFMKGTDKDKYCATMEDPPQDTVENKHFCGMIILHDRDAKKLYHHKVHKKIHYFEENMHAAISKLLSVDG